MGDNFATLYGGGLEANVNARPNLLNCVFWSNMAWNGPELAARTFYNRPARLLVQFCDVQYGQAGVYLDPGCELEWGHGNLSLDPQFVDPAGGDYHLSAGSSCIEAGFRGAPEPGRRDIDGQVRVWDGDRDGRADIDIGADEFGSRYLGDLNCDGQVNNFDITAFMLALLDPDGYAEQYRDCDRALGDVNEDGRLDNFDIDPFIALLAR